VLPLRLQLRDGPDVGREGLDIVSIVPPIEHFDSMAVLIGEVHQLRLENESLRRQLLESRLAMERAFQGRNRGGW
jgi:hypothetical protein